jgi:redox-sensitive bicupin YhaK (pirin superfamily)
VARDGLTVTVLMGTLEGATSPARTYTPLVGAEVLIAGDGGTLTLRPDFEYAVLAAGGSASVEGAHVAHGSMLYLGTGRKTLRLRAEEAASLLLLGGEPFEEQLVMWWNFVGRSGEEIAEYAERWNAEDDRFGVVVGYDGDRLPAPALPAMPLKARGRVR